MNRIFSLLFVASLCTAFDSILSAQSLSEKLLSESPSQLIEDVTALGDPVRGAIVFYRAELNCNKCHETNQRGRALGPDLAQERNVSIADLVQSVLNPSTKIREGFETQLFALADGRQISGVVVSENDSVVVIDRIEEADKPLEIGLDDIDERRLSEVSMMPAGLANQLSDRREFLDLVSYLAEIAKGGPTRAAQLRPVTASFALAPLPSYESQVDHRGLIESWDAGMKEQGSQIFRLRCASCHGDGENEGSMPTSMRFAIGQFKHGSDPYSMYQTLTHGYGMMIPQRWMVPEEKYAVIHYIRESFLKLRNPTQYHLVDEEYLAGLPVGNTRGPKPVSSQPWTAMNYGPSFINTIEVPGKARNIAQKGITIRLDEGPGGVESGRYWMMYDHDTMRMAAAWGGEFIDYEGIHFNGAHGRHPKVTGLVHFQNPDGPGWGRPSDRSFADDRLVGRDGNRYGPLPRDWAQYRGLYRHGLQTIIDYSVGNTRILETPGIRFSEEAPTFIRMLNIGPRDQDLELQITNSPLSFTFADGVLVSKPPEDQTPQPANTLFDGANFLQLDAGQDFPTHATDFAVVARIKTKQDGTLWSKTRNTDQWVANGQSLFIRDGRLVFDVGWVGAVQSKKRVNDNKWHDVAMTWEAKTKTVRLYVDGEKTGEGELAPAGELVDSVVRIGATNGNFPEPSYFDGDIAFVGLYSRMLGAEELSGKQALANKQCFAHWTEKDLAGTKVSDEIASKKLKRVSTQRVVEQPQIQVLSAIGDRFSFAKENWKVDDSGNVRLNIPAGSEPIRLCIQMTSLVAGDVGSVRANHFENASTVDLQPLTQGGARNWPEFLETEIQAGPAQGAFAVDVLTHPVENPDHCRLRLTGLEFIPGEDAAYVCTWDGSVWRVDGIGQGIGGKLNWTRIAGGLFQPLGIKIREGTLFVTCRDQLVALHDRNGDGEMDWYECYNNDHQVTEHFHEFAMGLQTDDQGNFYYAKSARHALTALVPHHGTLLKISADGKKTDIIANGFRAANGVCLNPDGSFVVTDQEGHWNPKNRINWVRDGGFYGNMFGYHDVTDSSDEAMEPPLCWITNAFDRSPAELLWVDSERWSALNGALLNFSYGYGKIYVVPHEEVDGQMQGGMCAFDLPSFPTGIMRGRFSPLDGQLYCCGMFAWSSTQEQPGGFYRVRYDGGPMNLPVGLQVTEGKITLTFTDPIDVESANNPKNYAIRVWGLKRTANYGSEHYDQHALQVTNATLLENQKTVVLDVADLAPTWCMEIVYVLKDAEGHAFQNKIHNTIHHLAPQTTGK